MTLRCEIVESPSETGKHSREGPKRTWNSTVRDWAANTPATPSFAWPAAFDHLAAERFWPPTLCQS